MQQARRHPACSLAKPPPPLLQGPHWWDECPWPLKGACTAPPNGDFDGYIDLFSKAAESIQKDPMVRGGGSVWFRCLVGSVPGGV